MATATSSLNTIQQKVRRLTRSPSENQLTTTDLNQYINTFVLYDFPEQLKLFNLKTTFSFYTQPFVDTYSTVDSPITSPLYDFQNIYLTVEPPVYIAGYQALFLESRDQFYGIYPQVNNIASIGFAGDGSTTRFSGVINSQQANIQSYVNQQTLLLQNNVLFSSVDVNNNGLTMTDYPIVSAGNPVGNTIGNLRVPNEQPTSTTTQDPNNYINYLTGEFVVTFQTAPQSGFAINSQTILVQPTLPQTMLFYDGKFTLRPVPDQPYTVQMEVYKRPTELLTGSQNPNLNEWWQYIAYGTAKKIFEDRMDLESVQQIMPEFKTQEALILRRTIVQQTSQRVATIYENNNSSGMYGAGWFSGGSNF